MLQKFKKLKPLSKVSILIMIISVPTLFILYETGYIGKIHGPAAVYDIELENPVHTYSHIPIGAAVDTFNLEENEEYRDLVLTHFNSIVSEWQMKWDHIQPEKGVFFWEKADVLVDFAEENNIQIHAHALLWHEQLPEWVENFSGTNEEFKDIIKTYIQTYVGRYKGRIASWDVVNEAFLENEYRNTIFYERLGRDYIKYAFNWAHDADPDVSLYYNDYSICGNPSKAEFVIQELTKYIDEGVPIDGVGLQAHITYEWPNLDNIIESMDLWNDFGLDIRISEMDVSMNNKGRYTVLTDEMAQNQKQRINNVVSVFLDVPKLTGITFWGVYDGHTWIPNHRGNPDWPLLFDVDYQPKPAVEGLIDAFFEKSS